MAKLTGLFLAGLIVVNPIYASDGGMLPITSLQSIMNQSSFTYFDNGAGAYTFFDFENNNIPCRQSTSAGYTYAYIPMYLTGLSSVTVAYSTGVSATNSTNPSSRYPNTTAVHAVVGGASVALTPTVGSDWISSHWRGTANWYVHFYNESVTYTGQSIDTIRLTCNPSGALNVLGLRYIVAVTSGGDITIIINMLGDLESLIAELIDTIKANGAITSTQLINITNYLSTITTVSDDDKLLIVTLQGSYDDVRQKMQQYTQIINSADAAINAPAPSDIAPTLDAGNVFPDADFKSIGAGTSESGIGLLVNHPIVVKLLLAVFGVATLAYIIYGKRT